MDAASGFNNSLFLAVPFKDHVEIFQPLVGFLFRERAGWNIYTFIPSWVKTKCLRVVRFFFWEK
jgi:hypothetical protein